jgi:hypothetical protein
LLALDVFYFNLEARLFLAFSISAFLACFNAGPNLLLICSSKLKFSSKWTPVSIRRSSARNRSAFSPKEESSVVLCPP